MLNGTYYKCLYKARQPQGFEDIERKAYGLGVKSTHERRACPWLCADCLGPLPFTEALIIRYSCQHEAPHASHTLVLLWVAPTNSYLCLVPLPRLLINTSPLYSTIFFWVLLFPAPGYSSFRVARNTPEDWSDCGKACHIFNDWLKQHFHAFLLVELSTRNSTASSSTLTLKQARTAAWIRPNTTLLNFNQTRWC